MATNKRKEAAALFELIDKSTLKVSKGGGSLKIPSWWSSKSNQTNKEAPSRDAVGADPATSTTGVALEEAPASTAGKAPEQKTAPQTRLFEPPPANVMPSNSPSIRPPKAPLAAVIAEPVNVSSEGASSGAASDSKDPETASRAKAPASQKGTSAPVAPASGVRPERGGAGAVSAGSAPASSTFVPSTKDPGRKVWSPPRPGILARVPMWAIVASAAVPLLLIVFGVVMIAKSGGKTTAPTTQGALVGQVYEGGTVARSKDLYYVVVYSTPAGNAKPADSVAYKNAKFLADHGIDVSLERVDQPVRGVSNKLEGWYWVVTTKGFASLTEAKPFRDQIVEIGDQMSPGAWKGAFARDGLSSPGTGGRSR